VAFLYNKNNKSCEKLLKGNASTIIHLRKINQNNRKKVQNSHCENTLITTKENQN